MLWHRRTLVLRSVTRTLACESFTGRNVAVSADCATLFKEAEQLFQ